MKAIIALVLALVLTFGCILCLEKVDVGEVGAEAQAEIDRTKAQTAADVELIEAKAEAEANRVIAQSITPELIQMKEAEARLEHGWVTVQGADSVVVR